MEGFPILGRENNTVFYSLLIYTYIYRKMGIVQRSGFVADRSLLVTRALSVSPTGELSATAETAGHKSHVTCHIMADIIT